MCVHIPSFHSAVLARYLTGLLCTLRHLPESAGIYALYKDSIPITYTHTDTDGGHYISGYRRSRCVNQSCFIHEYESAMDALYNAYKSQ